MELYPTYAEARAKVECQTIEEDLDTIDTLFGRSNLCYGATHEDVKAEALRQVKIVNAEVSLQIKAIRNDALQQIAAAIKREDEYRKQAEASNKRAEILSDAREISYDNFDEEVVTAAEAASICRVTSKSVRRWIEAGVFPKPVLSKSNLNVYRKSDIEAFASTRTRKPHKPHKKRQARPVMFADWIKVSDNLTAQAQNKK